MSDETSRTSRFRRSSRFRTPKEMPALFEGTPAPAPPPPPPVEEPDDEEEDYEEPQGFINDQDAGFDFPEEIPPEEQIIEQNVCRVNALTIDVKEWFQTAALREVIKFSHWGKYERRIERGIHFILALLRQYNVKATFFILGIVAREFPEIVRLIAQEGHEIGTMGYYNRMLDSIPPEEYIRELEMSLSILRSLTNKDIIIHRAPEWSVKSDKLWIMDVLKTYGIKYDSSIYPVKGNHYGIEKSPRYPYSIHPSGIIEFPPSTYTFAGKRIALFGGTYLRIIPYNFVSMGIKDLNNAGHPVMIHVSPWEVEAEFPKIKLSWDGFMSQYAGVKSTFSRLSKILEDFNFDTLTRTLEENPPTDSFHISNISDPGKKKNLPDFEPITDKAEMPDIIET